MPPPRTQKVRGNFVLGAHAPPTKKSVKLKKVRLCLGRESNPRPFVLQTNALPLSYLGALPHCTFTILLPLYFSKNRRNVKCAATYSPLEFPEILKDSSCGGDKWRNERLYEVIRADADSKKNHPVEEGQYVSYAHRPAHTAENLVIFLHEFF